MIFHDFPMKTLFLAHLQTYVNVKFYGGSIFDGFRTIRNRQVDQNLKKTEKIQIRESQVNPLSRTSPRPTVVGVWTLPEEAWVLDIGTSDG